MKVLAFILSTVLGTALVAGGVLLIVTQSSRHSAGLDLLAIFALTILIYGPLVLGSLTSYWDVRGSQGSRSFFLRYLWVVVGLEVLAAVAIVLFAVLAGAPVWLPILFIAGGAVLTPLALAVGGLLQRHEQAHPRADDEWMPVGRREIQRKVLIVAGIFVAAYAVGVVAFGALLSPDIGGALVIALQFASLAAAVACIAFTVPLNRRLRSTVGGDLGTVRKVGRVVLSKKDLDLDPAERVAAAKYAAIVPTVLSFTLGWTTLLYLSIAVQQVRSIVEGQNAAFSVGLAVLLVAMLVFLVPYYAVRIGRAQRYAREHAAELTAQPDGSGDTGGTPSVTRS
ncbi:hypothetical protein [Leifsonia sp. NCR5]|uniref:hypothetical protein n=1 Tax=Leifsonia sp. NCR5 TaxID=1978342 RepID=UPI000A18A7CF|nr:hypothetical protein [Leifsonia sp. NCR5]